MQEQLLDISKQLVLEYRLQSCSMRVIQQSSDSISRECRTDSGTHSLHLIAQFFITQSELPDQQRERLTSAMSLRNISLENYSYEMLKTHYHELFITTRTSIQDPSDLKEATAATTSSSSNKVNTKEKKTFGLRMKKDLKDSCQTTMKRRSGSSRRTMRS